MEPIVFPDATAVVTAWLDSHLIEPVHSRVPANRPTAFVTVVRTGGPRRNIIADNPQVTVESWAATVEEAHDLAQTVRAYVNALIGETVNGVFVSRVDELSGPADLPDPLSEQPRYSQSFSFVTRGEVLTGS